MKKAPYIIVFLSLFISFAQLADAQEKRNFSYVYLYKASYKGLYSMFNKTSYFVRFGNQDFGSINDAPIRYKIYSSGRINLNLVISGQTRGITLDIDSFKDYYLKIDVKDKNFLVLESAGEASKLLDTANVVSFDEDLRSPINSSATENAHKSEKGQGTCFLISPGGYLLTNNHCVEGAKEITVKGIDADFTTKYGATVVATDPSNDLALLKLGNKNLKFNAPPTAIRSSGVAQAEKVYALGFPKANAMGEEVKITEGIISSKSGVGGDISKFQISAAVNPGNSGGPLIDEQGNIIGVIYAKSTIAESAGYAVKASYLEAFLKKVDSFGYPTLVNTMKEKPFTDIVAEWKKYIYILETN